MAKWLQPEVILYQGIMKAQGTNYVASGASWTGMSPNFGSANKTWTPDAGQSATNQAVGLKSLIQNTATAKKKKKKEQQEEEYHQARFPHYLQEGNTLLIKTQ